MRPANHRCRIPAAMLLIATVLTLSLVQCRRSDSGDDRADATVTGDEADSPDDGRTMRLTDAGRGRTTPEPAGERDDDGAAPPGVRIDPRDSAFAARRLDSTARYPIDYHLGPLGPAGLAAAEEAARAAARVFLEDVGSTGVPSRPLLGASPGALEELGRLAGDAAGTTGIRTGRPTRLPSGEVSVPFRLMDDSGGWTGELVLERADGEWYTSDIQVNRLRLGEAGPYAPDRSLPDADW